MSEAVLWHLWPKLYAAPGRSPSMSIQVRTESRVVDIPDPATHPVLEGFCVALQAVRDVQTSGEFDDFNTEVHRIELRRPKKLAGHLAIHRWPSTTAASDDAAGLVRAPVSAVALMRHEAELVVKYDELQPLPGALQWAGVFKPVAETDDAFTDAEPPSHDAWEPANVRDRNKKSIVNVSLRNLRELLPKPSSARSDTQSSATRGAAQLATALADLAAPIGTGASANRKAKSGGGGSMGKRSSVRPIVRQVTRRPGDDGRTEFILEIACEAPHNVRAKVEARVAVDGGKADAAPDLITLRALDGAVIGDVIDIAPGRSEFVVVDAPSELAIDANVLGVAP